MQPSLNHRSGGYILIELAFVMIVLSILLAVSIPLYNSYEQRNAIKETEQRMEAISRAFSTYAQSNFRLPCPADSSVPSGNQFGVERAACDAATFATTPETTHGIVPYRTLGIPEQYAKDGYGNFFTYAVSPDFTVDNRLTIPDGNFTTNQVNLRLAHLVAGNNTTGNYALLPHSKFCAPIQRNAPTDLTVTRSGNEIYAENRLTDPDIIVPIPTNAPNPNLNNSNVLDASGNTIANRDINVTAVAIALISHGENGRGAYQADGGQSQAAPAGSAEQITSSNTITGSATSLTIQIEPQRSENYDDIVKFYTQDQIYALAGRNSCEHL